MDRRGDSLNGADMPKLCEGFRLVRGARIAMRQSQEPDIVTPGGETQQMKYAELPAAARRVRKIGREEENLQPISHHSRSSMWLPNSKMPTTTAQMATTSTAPAATSFACLASGWYRGDARSTTAST